MQSSGAAIENGRGIVGANATALNGDVAGAKKKRTVRAATTVFAGSAGGHLDELVIAAHRVRNPESVWVTSRTARGEALRTTATHVELLPEFGRSPLKALRNAAAAARVVVRQRPRFVLTSGAGVVVPFCVLARLAGARIVYVETMARVTDPSMSAKLLSRIAARVIVQWPELAEQLPQAIVCRPTLLENIAQNGRSPGIGTFVAVGTHRQPHRRLLAIVARAIEDGLLPPPIRAQVGPAAWTANGAEVADYMPTEELEAAVRSAAVVVCHGGAGIICSALAAGRKPIVIPRRAAFGEHVDDHQYQLTSKLADLDLVVPGEQRITAAAVQRAMRPLHAPAELLHRPSAANVVRAELSPLADTNIG